MYVLRMCECKCKKVSFLKGKKEEGDKVLAAARVGGYRRQSSTLPLNAP